MYQKNGSPYSENFVPSDHLTETVEVLFPITETQTPDYAATIAVTVKEMGTLLNVAALTGSPTINLTIDEQVSKGAEIVMQLTASGADRTVTLGTGLSGSAIVVPSGTIVQALFKYDGTNFRLVSSSTIVVADGSITHAKLAADAVETDNIKDSNVTHAKLAADAVETDNIKDANVTHAKLAADAVETDNIKDANITTAKIATDGVESGNIKAKAVTTAKIDDAAVTGTQIANLAVDTEHIAAKAVETAKIDDLAVTAAQLAADAVETAKIKDANVTLAKLAAGTNGDIMYYNSGWQVLPIGTTGQTLKVSSGGIPEWTT